MQVQAGKTDEEGETDDNRHKGEKCSSLIRSFFEHAHQAVIRFCLTSADHARAPEHVFRERVHASLVIHNRHSYTLQVLIRLICFEEEEGALLLGLVQTKSNHGYFLNESVT